MSVCWHATFWSYSPNSCIPVNKLNHRQCTVRFQWTMLYCVWVSEFTVFCLLSYFYELRLKARCAQSCLKGIYVSIYSPLSLILYDRSAMSNLSTFQTLACKVRLNVSSAKTSKKDLRSFNYRQIVDRLQCHLNDSVDSYVVIIVPISHLQS